MLRPLRGGHAQHPQSAADVPALSTLSSPPTLTKTRSLKRIPVPAKIHTASPVAQPEASDNEVEEADEEESSNEDDDSDSGNGGGGGRQARKRQRVEPRQTRNKARQAEVDKLQQTLPTASVCIQMNASMWPGEDPHFTDGVESVFLEDDSDAEDDVPMGEVLYGDCYVSGEWGLDAREVLRRYAENEATLQDAQGNPLDLDIDDPEEGEE